MGFHRAVPADVDPEQAEVGHVVGEGRDRIQACAEPGGAVEAGRSEAQGGVGEEFETGAGRPAGMQGGGVEGRDAVEADVEDTETGVGRLGGQGERAQKNQQGADGGASASFRFARR